MDGRSLYVVDVVVPALRGQISVVQAGWNKSQVKNWKIQKNPF